MSLAAISTKGVIGAAGTLVLAQSTLPPDGWIKSVVEGGATAIMAACVILLVVVNTKQYRAHAQALERMADSHAAVNQKNVESMLVSVREQASTSRALTDAVMQMVSSSAKQSTRAEQLMATISALPCSAGAQHQRRGADHIPPAAPNETQRLELEEKP